ncbi:Fatty-acid amide hydrolase 2-A, partial [Trichinella pseudospiralis]
LSTATVASILAFSIMTSTSEREGVRREADLSLTSFEARHRAVDHHHENESWMKMIAFAISKAWYRTVDFIFSAINTFKTRKQLPAIEDEVLLKSATDLASYIRTGTLTSESVVKAYIGRICAINPFLNVMVEHRFATALMEARKIDDMIRQHQLPNKDVKPLLGVPITVKESIAVEGMCTTYGLAVRRGAISEQDADVVAALRNAGAILLATTNVSEACMWWESYNPVYGLSRNPYDVRRTVGGSSGGEAALVGAAGSVIGVGSDIGGSIRIPSAFCGVFGHKPSKGVVSSKGCKPDAVGSRADMNCVGPICRYAEDLVMMLSIMMKPEYYSILKLHKKVNMNEVKVFYFEEILDSSIYPLSPCCRDALRAVVLHLETEFNVTSEEAYLPSFHQAMELWFNEMYIPDASFQDVLTDGQFQFNIELEMFKWFFRLSKFTLPSLGLAMIEKYGAFFNAFSDKDMWHEMGRKAYRQFEDLLGENGVLIMPSHPTTAPYHHQPLLMPLNFAYTAVLNVLGVPVTACPVGIDENGMPISVQIAAIVNNDRLCLAVAQELARKFKGWRKPH